MVISLGWLSPATSRGLPAAQTTRAGSRCLLGLAPTGGYRATPVARRAVGSYPTFSPLPFGYRAVCFLWPCPSPYGAQALPGSLPYGARTFLSAPFTPAHRDHRTLPPPGPKGTGPPRVRASLMRESPDEAGHAVHREPRSGASPSPSPRAGPGPAVVPEPKAVILLEHEALEPRDVAGTKQRRWELHRVHGVDPAPAQQGQRLARLHLRRKQQQWPVGESESAQQPVGEPVGRCLRQPEGEGQIAALPQHAVAQRGGAFRNQILERPVVEREQSRLPQRPIALAVGERIELAAPGDACERLTPRRVAELLAHRILIAPPVRAGAPLAPEIEPPRDHQRALVPRQAPQRRVGRAQAGGPQRRLEDARRGRPLAAGPARGVGGRQTRVGEVEGGNPAHARGPQPLDGIAPGAPHRIALVPTRSARVGPLGCGIAGEHVQPADVEERDERIEHGARPRRPAPVPRREQRQ